MSKKDDLFCLLDSVESVLDSENIHNVFSFLADIKSHYREQFERKEGHYGPEDFAKENGLGMEAVHPNLGYAHNIYGGYFAVRLRRGENDDLAEKVRSEFELSEERTEGVLPKGIYAGPENFIAEDRGYIVGILVVKRV